MNTDARCLGCELTFSGTRDEAFLWLRYHNRVHGPSPRVEAITTRRLQPRSVHALAYPAALSALAAPSKADRSHGHG